MQYLGAYNIEDVVSNAGVIGGLNLYNIALININQFGMNETDINPSIDLSPDPRYYPEE